MFSRRKMYNYSIGGGIFAIFLGLVAIWSLIEQSRELRTHVDRLRAESEPSKAPPESTLVGTTDDLGYSDLVAQQRMADAAEALLYATCIQVLLSAVGVIFVLRSLGQTASAMGIAEKTRVDADRHAKQQMRSYLSMKPMTLVGLSVGSPIWVMGEIVNSGQTPAYKMRHDGNIVVIPSSVLVPAQIPPFSNLTAPYTLHPAEHYQSRTTSVAVLSQTDFNDIASGAGKLLLIGSIHYNDAFGAPHVTQFSRWILFDAQVLQAMRDRVPGNFHTFFEVTNFHNDAD